MVQDELDLAHARVHVDGQVRGGQVSGLRGGEEILAVRREGELESAGGIGGGLELPAGWVNGGYGDSPDARFVFVDGAAGHRDFGSLR